MIKETQMKNIFISSILVIGFAACEPNTTPPPPTPYVTDNLIVSSGQKAFVHQTTASWCHTCPIGTERMLEVKEENTETEIKVLGFASHTGDPLVTPVQDELNILYPSTGIPHFYVNNADASQFPKDPTLTAISQTAPVGVSHVASIKDGDSMMTVDIKVKFFEDKKNISYYVQSYLLVSGIEGKEYNLGGVPIDLNQQSSQSTVTQGSGSSPSKWAVDTFSKKAGDIYTHDNIPYASGNTPFQWGVTLDTINPLGKSYFQNDIFGSEYTPIQIKIPLKVQGIDLDAIEAALGKDLDYDVVTIIWSERFDGSPGVLFVNGFQG